MRCDQKWRGISSFSEAKRRSNPCGGPVFRNAKAILKVAWITTGLKALAFDERR
jgi:hypothetical protein